MSLVAWYPLIDGSLENKGLDTTPLALHGIVPFTNGRVRTAPTFSANASNYYTMPPITKVNDFSICCWVKCSSTANGWIFYQGVVGYNNKRLGFIDASGAEGKLKYVYGNIYYTVPYTSNTWVHMCMTIDENGLVHTYLNGENINNSSTDSGYEYVEGHDLHIGIAETVQPLQNGQLQDFRYYDHCLSPKEVKEIAKGLCLHLPLKGTNARPNLFKNSATMFDTFGPYPQSNPPVTSRELVFDESAPCGMNGKILRYNIERTSSDQAWAVGEYFTPSLGSNFLPELIIGNTYCVSYWARCSIDNKVTGVQNFVSGTLIKSSDLKLTSEWKRYYQIFIATSTGVSNSFYVSKINVGDKGVFEVCCPKLELLSPTPYIPNVDDTQYSDYVLDYEPDCSGNEFDATKHGDLTTSDSNGRYNTAVAFNGTNTYLQGLAPTNSECKEFTIATWVKLNYNTLNQAIYACRTVVGQGLVLFYLGATGGIRLDDGVDNAVFSNSTLEPNKWYHIAVTRDATERKLYINGEFVSSGVTTGALTNMANMYQVGESNAQTTTPIGNFLNGSLSDLRLYTSVLSADDVKELYETSVSIAHNPPSLTESAYYNYVEGQKHSTFDKSKFTIVGSPTITDDGIASGFSGSNYLTTANINKSLNTFKIEGEFITSDSITTEQTIFTTIITDSNSTARSLALQQFTNGTLYCYVPRSSGGNWIVGTTVLQVNTKYYFKINFDGVNVTWSYGTDKNNLVAQPSVACLASTLNNVIRIGLSSSGSGSFLGSIDLKQFSITVDSKEVFNGNKTGIDTIKPDNYTVVGTPTISADGIASGFSSGNYLTTTQTLGNSIKVFSTFKTPQSDNVTANSAIWQIKTSPTIELQVVGRKMFIINSGGTITAGKFDFEYDTWYDTIFEYNFTTGAYKLSYKKSADNNYIELTGTQSGWVNMSLSDIVIDFGTMNRYYWYTGGSIDLNAYKIYVDSSLVYQPCLKIPYTLGSTGIKIVDSVYLDRVKDVYDQHYPERYYTIDETTQTVYEYPLFRDSMHSYEFDEGIQASITKNGIHNATTLTEAAKTSIYQNNTDTVALIEN